MGLSDKAFEVLDTLDRQPIFNQRQLARHAGISLGQVNYILKSLLDKGFVKIGNFRRSPNKAGYMYLLTAKGIHAKSRLAAKFVTSKLIEYDNLRNRLGDKLDALEKKGHRRIAFVGPQVVKDFADTVIRDRGLKLALANRCKTWKDLKAVEPNSFDIVLLFDGSPHTTAKISEATGLHRDRLVPLW
jgi:EPS-associated MarR family transcriptional regulator